MYMTDECGEARHCDPRLSNLFALAPGVLWELMAQLLHLMITQSVKLCSHDSPAPDSMPDKLRFPVMETGSSPTLPGMIVSSSLEGHIHGCQC